MVVDVLNARRANDLYRFTLVTTDLGLQELVSRTVQVLNLHRLAYTTSRPVLVQEGNERLVSVRVALNHPTADISTAIEIAQEIQDGHE